MASNKFWKRETPLSKLEETVANYMLDLENSSTEFKAELKNVYLDSIREVEVAQKNGKKGKNVVLITVPHMCVRVLHRALKRVTGELEKKLKATVLFQLKRKIESKWIKVHRS
jgi:Cft2 family RNA processing exonuclease